MRTPPAVSQYFRSCADQIVMWNKILNSALSYIFTKILRGSKLSLNVCYEYRLITGKRLLFQVEMDLKSICCHAGNFTSAPAKYSTQTVRGFDFGIIDLVTKLPMFCAVAL